MDDKKGGAPALELRGVVKSFWEGKGRERVSRPVLRGVDGVLEAGEAAVLVGRSGSGKSTLLGLVAGMDLPDAGTIRVAGKDLHPLSERERSLLRRRHIGFVFQSYNLLPTLTVTENIFLPLELAGMAGEESRRRVLRLLSAVGLSDRARAFPDVLSGGEQQRIALVRALAHGPSLLLADEPTGNLDAAMGRTVLGLLESLTRAEGAALLIATHSPESIAFPHRLARLVDGRLDWETGAP